MASSEGSHEAPQTTTTKPTISSSNKAAENDSTRYFDEDEIFTIDKRNRVKFGVVVPLGYIDEEDPNKVRICLQANGKETSLPLDRVGLVDRTLAPGDVVRRSQEVEGRPKQFGYCQEMTVCADMNVLGTNYVIKNVPAKRCAPLHRMAPGVVMYDSWIGVSELIKEKLVLQTTCGSLLEVVMSADFCPLTDIDEMPSLMFISCPAFHVGQTLVGSVSSLEDVKWLYTSPEMRGCRKSKHLKRKFVVQSVELSEVTIHWQIKPNVEVNSLDEISYSEPPKVVSGDDLKRIKPMNVFHEAMLQIHDKLQLVVHADDETVTRHEWNKEMTQQYHLPKSRSPKRSSAGTASAVRVVVSGEEDKDQSVFAVPAVPSASGPSSRQNLKPPPVTRGHSLGKLEGEKKHHSQFLTVTADSRRSHSLDAAVSGADLPEGQSPAGEFAAEDDGSETSASCSEFSSNTPSSCSITPRGSPKCSPLLANKMRRLHKQKQQHRRKKRHDRMLDGGSPAKVPEAGQSVVVRAVLVRSSVTVLWQDGTLERDIPSRELFPIHTLDHHEFFPSDFVLAAGADKDTDDWHSYGVIQTMDHAGRFARVKWFETAKAYDQEPRCQGETEVSVYDLKDHLQFQYRPGTIVVRLRKRSSDGGVDEEVADGDQLGQVIDNSPEGKVKVVWVNKKVSSCWPQDIFELGNYDCGMFVSRGHLSLGEVDEDEYEDEGAGGDDSWLTESVESCPGDHQAQQGNANPRMKPADRAYLSELLERLKGSLLRLKTLFKMNPQIFSGNVVQELMVIFKKCRYFDRLMDTQFFSEENFEGLVERVRKTAALGQTTRSSTSGAIVALAADEVAEDEEENAPFLNASHSTPIKCLPAGASSGGGEGEGESGERSPRSVLSWPADGDSQHQQQLMDGINNLRVKEDEKRQSIKKGDSGHYSEMDEDHSSASSSVPALESNNNNNNNSNHSSGSLLLLSAKATTLTVLPPSSPPAAAAASLTASAIPMEVMCSKFCNLLMEQMGKAFHEINTVYCSPSSEWEVLKEESVTDLGKLLEDSATADEMNSSGQYGGEEEGVPGAPPESFLVVDASPTSHEFNLSLLQPTVPKVFFRAVKREHDMLRSGLPEGVWVRAYEERVDLFSVMIEGPKKTPYEDGLFLFDIQLGSGYPADPPECHYISYCHDRLNPNLYEEGRVCVSLLGTWAGEGSEVWGPNSSLLQLIVSIQGLILVAEPYFNEAGYERHVGTRQGCENSQIYNEMVVIKLVQSMMKMLEAPPVIFRDRILAHFRRRGLGMVQRIRDWVAMSKKGEEEGDSANVERTVPDFPLVPASKGFCMTVESLLGRFQKVVEGL